MGSAGLWLVVPAALAAAAGFGLAGALQHASMARRPSRGSLRPGLLRDLIGQPLWMASIGATAVASALQLVALAAGPVTMVQPLLITGLLFAVFFRSLFRRRVPRRSTIAGAALCVAGLSAFLVIARPGGGSSAIQNQRALPIGVAVAVVLLVCLGLARWRPGRVRSLSLGLGGGLLYGSSATIAKVATQIFLSGGVVSLLLHWPLYAMAVLGPGGFLMTQHAYRAHRDLAPAQAVITLADPLVGIVLGILWLRETIAGTPLAVAGEVLGLVALGAGVWLLAQHAAAGSEEHTENRPATAEAGSS